jgi:hypothetical protein
MLSALQQSYFTLMQIVNSETPSFLDTFGRQMAHNHLVIMVTEHLHKGLLALQAVRADQVMTGCSQYTHLQVFSR